VSDRFFSLAVFLHIGVPLATLAGTWIHLQRLSHVRAWPPAVLGVPLLGALAALAVLHPAVSAGPADALAAPATLALDWFYHFPHALAKALSPEVLSMALVAGAAALAGLPWTRGPARPAAAVVDLANCNGCARCADDCPFGAVVMIPRTDGRHHPRQAGVIPDLCAACGICAGACPSSTPFRRSKRPEMPPTGIDLPDRTIAALREALDRALDAAPGAPVTFACIPAGPQPGAIEVECAAMVPPAFVQYALRHGASGVVIAACREGDCEHRLGDRWTRERFAGVRAPALRASVPRERVRLVFHGTERVNPDEHR
jgi:ferredoxin